ncbi:hypothetical protein [Microcoleus phage My-WqHQDG]|nr:hypothetical protein [Microcoleus phage My-WqHQDG]
MYDTWVTLGVLSLAISHMGWLITQSGMFRLLREMVAKGLHEIDLTKPFFYRFMVLRSLLAEGIECSICTITQLSLLLAWLLPDVVEGPALLVYLIKAMLLAKVSCIVYDLGEAIGLLSVGITYEAEAKL